VQPTNTWPHQRAQRSREWFSGEHSKMLVHVYIGQRDSRDSEHKIGTYLFHIWSYSHKSLQRHVRGWYLHCGQRIWYLGSRFAGECQNKLVPRNC
jgi:hypothetical protein